MTTTILGNILHPEYSYMAQRWREWRLTYESGHFYVEEYLKRFRREKRHEWEERKAFTYVPAFAKEAVNEVRNSVWGRLADVSRLGGSEDYVSASRGLSGGVDRCRTTMSDFVGRFVLPEMLTMRRVGVWVDMPRIKQNPTKAQVTNKHPYLYWYPVESIRSWGTDDEGKLTRILLKEANFMHDEATGLPMSGKVDAFRYAWIDESDGKVHVRKEDEEGKQLIDEFVLEGLTEIPFVQFEIEHSLLEDVCQHQVALLNMESSDVYWCIKANFPIYIEQFDPRIQSSAGRPAQQNTIPGRMHTDPTPPTPPGQAKQASESKDPERTVGVSSGIGYARDLNPPAFIHPSPLPLTASMAKELQIKEDIRRLVHLSVSLLDPKMASAESKQMDDKGLQTGLCAIGAALQRGDQEIAHHWAAYMAAEEATVRYPLEWSMQSDDSRRAEASALCDLKDQLPSRTGQKEILKQVANKLVGHKIDPQVLDKIHGEIDSAQYITADAGALTQDIQNHLVSAEFASETIRGYPKGEVGKAHAEQAKLLQITAISQAKGGGAAAARGLPSHPSDASGSDEKAGKAKRGEGSFNDVPLADQGASPVVASN